MTTVSDTETTTATTEDAVEAAQVDGEEPETFSREYGVPDSAGGR